MNKHPDCEDRCQILEHKGYHTCSQTGRCEQLEAMTAPQSDLTPEVDRLIQLLAEYGDACVTLGWDAPPERIKQRVEQLHGELLRRLRSLAEGRDEPTADATVGLVNRLTADGGRYLLTIKKEEITTDSFGHKVASRFLTDDEYKTVVRALLTWTRALPRTPKEDRTAAQQGGRAVTTAPSQEGHAAGPAVAAAPAGKWVKVGSATDTGEVVIPWGAQIVTKQDIDGTRYKLVLPPIAAPEDSR